LKKLLLVVSLLVSCLLQSVLSQQPQTFALRGRVVVARTGEPVAKVRIIANQADQSTTTDDNGEFTLHTIPAGQVDLYITTVNYGLVKKTITLKAGENELFLIALNEDAAALTEKVTITADPYETGETNAASEQTLNKGSYRRWPAFCSAILCVQLKHYRELLPMTTFAASSPFVVRALIGSAFTSTTC